MGTPQPTTGHAPGELLFGGKFHTKLLQLPTLNKRKYPGSSNSQKSRILLKECAFKSKPPHNPHPFEVLQVRGH